MKNVLIILGFILAFMGGYFLSQNYNFKLETKNPSPTAVQVIVTSPPEMPTAAVSLAPSSDETEDFKTIIKQLLIEKHGESANGLTITVSKIQGDYARGGASETGGGAMWLAKKVNNNWQLVFDGNGVPDCNKLKTTYLFPTAILTGICD